MCFSMKNDCKTQKSVAKNRICANYIMKIRFILISLFDILYLYMP